MSIKKNVVAAACGLALAASAFAPGLAFATNDGNGNYTDEYQGKTTVKVELAKDDQDNAQLSFSIPTQIAFAAHSDGTLKASNVEIRNNSGIFPIHVKNVLVEMSKDNDPDKSWKLVSENQLNAEGIDYLNQIFFDLNGVDASECAIDGGKNVKWTIEAANKISFEPTGKIRSTDKDLNISSDLATITWTFDWGTGN